MKNILGNIISQPDENINNGKIWNPFDPGYGINIFAGLLQIVVVLILLGGIDIGKFAVNIFTVIKMILVLFMIISGLLLFQPENLSGGWAPMGMGGILRGATSCFFGFIGYDEVLTYVKYVWLFFVYFCEEANEIVLMRRYLL